VNPAPGAAAGYAARIRIGGTKTRGESGGTHFPCFDGLRAIAALLVIGVHTAFASGFDGRHGSVRGYTSRLEIGVEVFFVVSGFLLYRPFAVDHMGGKPALPTRAFWVRRLKRIIPAYWAAFLIITYVMRADTVRHAWYSPFIYLGFAQIYSPNYALTGITQAWSLCTEMTFYLLLPLYAGVMIRRRRTPDEQMRSELLGLVALVVIGLAFRIPVLTSRGNYAHTMPNWLPAYLDQFALGMLLAVISAWLAATGRRLSWMWHPALPWVSWALAGASFVSVSNIGLPWTPITPNTLGANLVRQTLYGLFAFFLVLPAVFGPQDRSLIRRLLRFRPLVSIGIVSYGVYLWHEAWLNKFFAWTGDHLFTIPLPEMIAVVALPALASATLSYVLLERPILRWKPNRARTGPWWGRPVPALIARPAIAGAERSRVADPARVEVSPIRTRS
jgi:peptidoglycan/LPS O-acetylase OafA/YrhL